MAIETYELRICGTHMGSYNECVMHYQGTGTDPADTMSAGRSLIAGFVANCEAQWLAALPPTYEIRQYQARRVVPVFSAVAKETYGIGVAPGTRGATGSAMQLCPAIDLIPAMGTKSMGRIFLPAVAQGDIVQNVYAAGYSTIITTLITALLTAFSNAGIAWVKVVLSRKLGTSSPVISGRQSPVVGFQKRRRAPTPIT